MNPLLLTMAGGAIGAGARFLVGGAASRAFGSAFPLGTLGVNIIGGLLMGVLAARLAGIEHWRLFLGVGVLGGFTTFSAFSLETFSMIQRGQTGLAISYAMLSVVGSVGALALGLTVARAL